ncbi:FGGY-family carbohydrate kinase [Rhizobium sp. SGZ-381]|uniref:FGGY-family carbohydrate kinase n=1 Tax=Rhizobium sp. SGZ-381 TaxID=3342800 RepID=UPI00366A64C0
MTGYARVAVLDVGKTNAKVAILDCASGQELDMRRVRNHVIDAPPYPHYDIEALWRFFRKALQELAGSVGFDAISITTHGASAALVDVSGELALPVLDYEHRYPPAIEEAYAALRPPFIETFSPALPGGLNLGAQLHYQKTVFADEFARVAQIMTYPQYWAFRLTGIAANEVTSLGCHTDLWCPRDGGWSGLVDALGIRQQMAPVRSAFDRLGDLLPQLAAELGLPSPVPVFCGLHDSNASLLAHLVGREPPFSVVSTGTWVVSFAVGGDLDHLDPARDTLANVDAYGRAVPSARFMGGREYEMLASALGPLDSQVGVLQALPAVIASGLMLLPNVAEGSGPFPGRRMRWIERKGGEGPGRQDRWAAASLYLALMTEACLDLLGADGPVLVEGPFAANEAYLAALAGLLGRSVLALAGSTGTTHGAALLCGSALPSETGRAVVPLSAEGLAAYRAQWRSYLG